MLRGLASLRKCGIIQVSPAWEMRMAKKQGEGDGEGEKARDGAQWRAIVASSLDWEQAHGSLESSIKGLSTVLRGRRPQGLPHSVWELLEHIRITQHDLLDFIQNPKYEEKLKWPDDYWPKSQAPASDKAWNETVAAWRKDRMALERFTTQTDIDLTTKIPHGTGQTYLRTVLVALDHAAYHIGQIVSTRRLLGAWPPAK